MLCKQVRLTNRAPIAACPASGRRTAARAEGDNSTKQQNVPDEINDAAKDDMKYELREDMSNLRTTAINHPDTLGEAVDDTLGPRVRELRAKKLAQGTGDIGGAFARAFMALLGVCRPESALTAHRSPSALPAAAVAAHFRAAACNTQTIVHRVAGRMPLVSCNDFIVSSVGSGYCTMCIQSSWHFLVIGCQLSANRLLCYSRKVQSVEHGSPAHSTCAPDACDFVCSFDAF